MYFPPGNIKGTIHNCAMKVGFEGQPPQPEGPAGGRYHGPRRRRKSIMFITLKIVSASSRVRNVLKEFVFIHYMTIKIIFNYYSGYFVVYLSIYNPRFKLNSEFGLSYFE